MSKLSGKIGDPLDDTPDSELDKPSRAGFRWIWPKNLAIEKSIIVQYDSFNDLKAISIDYLISKSQCLIKFFRQSIFSCKQTVSVTPLVSTRGFLSLFGLNGL